MYDPLNLRDFFHILYIIRDNKNETLTHKEVRVYLDCMRELSEKLHVEDSYYLPSIRFHFHAMSCRLSHKKRSFLAERLLKLLLLLDKPNNSKQQDNLTQVEPESQPESKQKLTEEEEPDFLAERLLKLLLLLDKPNNSKQQDNLTQVEPESQPESKQKLTEEEEPDPDDIPFNSGDVSLLLETSPGNF